MTKDLEWYSRKPTNADELTEIRPYRDSARQNNEQLQTPGADQFNNSFPAVITVKMVVFMSEGTMYSIYKVVIKVYANSNPSFFLRWMSGSF